MMDQVGTGGTYPVAVEPNLAPTYLNAGPMAKIFQMYGTSDLSSNPNQAAAVQIALWDLSLNNHTPTYFVEDVDGTYSSGDESVFSVNFGGNPAATTIGDMVNQYLHVTAGATTSGSFLCTWAPPARGKA